MTSRSAIGRFDRIYRNKEENKAKIAELFNLISNMNSESIKQFSLINKISLNVRDSEYNNLIHKVILDDNKKSEYQRLNMIKFLVNENINPDEPNENNITPLHIAASKQYSEIIKYLLIDVRVNINFEDSNGNNFFHYFLGGNIIEYKNDLPKDLISVNIQKRKPVKTELLEIRKKIWEILKDEPFLKSIKETIENTMEDSVELNKQLLDFQKEINKILENPVSDIKQLKDIQGVFINQFRTRIEEIWEWKSNSIDEIEIHQKTKDSWPQNKPSVIGKFNDNMAILKDNYKNILNKNMDISIKNLIDSLPEKKLILGVNLENLINKYKQDYNNILPRVLKRAPYTNAFYLVPGTQDETKARDAYNKLSQEEKHPLAYDLADNIIDWEKLTFMAGSRILYVYHESLLNHDDISLLCNIDDNDGDRFEDRILQMATCLFTATASRRYDRGTGVLGAFVTNDRFTKINFIDIANPGSNLNFNADQLTFDNIDINNIMNTRNNMLTNFQISPGGPGGPNANGNDSFHRIVERYIAMFILAYIDSGIVTPQQVDLAETTIINNFRRIYAAHSGAATNQYPGNNRLLNDATNNIKYQKFIDHLKTKKDLDTSNVKKCASWLYSLISISLCIENHSSNDNGVNGFNKTKDRHDHLHTHLQGRISQTVLYLISAFANYQTDIIISISQACKLSLIDEIVSRNGFNAGVTNNVRNPIQNTYSCWIYSLLSEETNDIIIDNIQNPNEPGIVTDLEKIYHLSKAYFSDKTFTSAIILGITQNDIANLSNLSLTDLSKYALCEILITIILKYYDSMAQKPLLQHMVDTISLIRYYYISTKDVESYNYKLKSLYIKPLNRAGNVLFHNFMITNNNALVGAGINPNLIYNFAGSFLRPSNLDPLNRVKFEIDPDFVRIFGENNYTYELNHLTEFQIPSKINFYLENISKFSDRTNNAELTIKYNKLVEANYLGLNYIGKLFKLSVKNRNDNDEMELFNYSNNEVYLNLVGNSNSNIFSINALNSDRPLGPGVNIGAATIFATGGATPINFEYSPSTKLCYDFSLGKIINKLVELESRVTALIKQYFKNFSSKGISKTYQNIVIYLYPILNALFEHKKYILSLVSEDQIKDISKALDQFNRSKFENSINKINSYLYLFYYLSSTESLQIPTFLYYQFDLTPSPLLIFSQPPPIVYPSAKNDVSPATATSPPTDMSPYLNPSNNDTSRVASGSIYNIPISNYNSIRELISNRSFFKVRKIIKEAFVISKREKIPPSIKPFLNLFYKLSTLNFITNKLENEITLKLNDTEKSKLFVTSNEEIRNLNEGFTIAKIMEDVIKLYVNNVIYSIGFKLFNEKVLKNRTDLGKDLEYIKLLFDPVPFDVELNQELNDDIVKSISDILNSHDDFDSLFNYYQFSEFKDMDKLEEKKNDKFIIYPNDYNRTNLIKSRLCIKISKKLLDDLLINSAYGAGDINLQNNDNSSPLLFLLKFYNHDVIEYINNIIENKDGISYELDNIKLTDDVSLRYIKKEYQNNIDKFINQKTDLTDQIKAFTYGNFREIESIILSNDEFNRNVLKNLELSFVVCNYLTQQYLGLSLVYSGIKNKVTSLLSDNMNGKKLSDVFSGDGVASYFLEKAASPPNSKRGLYYELEDKVKFLQKKIQKYTVKKRRYEKAIIDLSPPTGNNSSLLDEKLRFIEAKITKYTEELARINILLNPPNNFNININIGNFNMINFLDLYKNFIDNHDRQSYMGIWKKLLSDSNITKNNPEIIISQMLNMEKENDYTKEGLVDLYEHFKMIGEEYFDEDKYLDKAPHHKFIRDLLFHLIQNVICVGIETLIRKILYNYFRTNKQDFNLYLSPGGTETGEEKINSYIEYILGNKIVDSTDTPQTDLSIKIILYQIVSKQMLLYSTRLFNNIEEENKYKNDDNNDIEEILNTFIDTLSELTPIKLNDEVILLFKKYIVSYFSSISFTLIKNWHITIENVFIYCINHYRILKCIKLISP